jgi:hypothetical protein
MQSSLSSRHSPLLGPVTPLSTLFLDILIQHLLCVPHL